SIFRAQPTPLVCAVAAVLPVVGPIIFLGMGTKEKPAEATRQTQPAAESSEVVNPMVDARAQHPTGFGVGTEHKKCAARALPQTPYYQGGQFTLNRRFFEPKFPGFFATIRRDSERDMVLVIKSSRGLFVGQRITRIASNDLHLNVQRGPASEEVMIPFAEV